MSKCINYDFHTHLLPAIDDGAKTVDDSIELLKQLNSYGINEVCFTPHFYTNEESVEDFLKRRDEAFTDLKRYIPNDLNMKFHVGGEIFLTDYLFYKKINKDLGIDNSNYILCEFSYDSDFTGVSLRYIESLLDNKYIPIIAHVERYPKLIKNKSARQNLLSMGCIFQSNFQAIVNHKTRRKVLSLIKKSEVTILGTDIHSKRHNKAADIKDATEILVKKFGPDIIDRFNDNAKEILCR